MAISTILAANQRSSARDTNQLTNALTHSAEKQ